MLRSESFRLCELCRLLTLKISDFFTREYKSEGKSEGSWATKQSGTPRSESFEFDKQQDLAVTADNAVQVKVRRMRAGDGVSGMSKNHNGIRKNGCQVCLRIIMVLEKMDVPDDLNHQNTSVKQSMVSGTVWGVSCTINQTCRDVLNMLDSFELDSDTVTVQCSGRSHPRWLAKICNSAL